jgi:hypothetical protein
MTYKTDWKPARDRARDLGEGDILEYALTEAAKNGDYKFKQDIMDIPFDTLHKAIKNNVLFCPNQRLTKQHPAVIWYKDQVISWNPDIPGSAAIMIEQITKMVKDNLYPNELLAWDFQGKPLTQTVVPMSMHGYRG